MPSVVSVADRCPLIRGILGGLHPHHHHPLKGRKQGHLWPRPDSAPGPGRQAGAGAGLRHRPPGPPAPWPLNSTPKAVRIKALGAARQPERPPPRTRSGRGYTQDSWDLGQAAPGEWGGTPLAEEEGSHSRLVRVLYFLCSSSGGFKVSPTLGIPLKTEWEGLGAARQSPVWTSAPAPPRGTPIP